MDRHLVAYLLFAVCMLAVAALIARAVYNSPRRVYRRSRLADQARWAARASQRGEAGKSAE
jgi:Tfp pilus assembly protein PilV